MLGKFRKIRRLSCGKCAAKPRGRSRHPCLSRHWHSLCGVGRGAAADFQHQTGTRQNLFQHRQDRFFVAFAGWRIVSTAVPEDAVLENIVRKQRYPRHCAGRYCSPGVCRIKVVAGRQQARERHGNPHGAQTGERGTQKLVAQYGPRLVCIRYRYDQAKKKRYKTIELIVAQGDWSPPEPHPSRRKDQTNRPKRFYTRRVGIRIEYQEADLRRQIKAAGGMWDPSERLWFIPEEEVRRLGLVQRVAKR